MEKPAEIFDRDFEWAELTRFIEHDAPRATLGVVSGRRRQGKTFLLDALADAAGGFSFTATEAVAADALHDFGAALARHVGEPVPFRFADWDEAISRLLRIGDGRPTVAVIDEFPFLAKGTPALPSIIQRALDPKAQRSNHPVRLLLCGSAMSFMGRLLAGTAPLRGRAGLELVVRTLDFRLAAEFWGITDPRTAIMTNAIVGGTPAYRKEFVEDDVPQGPGDFDDWVVRTVLNPARPIFREGRYLLAEEPELGDLGLYHSVLTAVAMGNTTRGGLACHLGRKATDVAHPLSVLQDVGLLSHETNAFRRNRSYYRIDEPLVGFYHAIMQPAWGTLERPGRGQTVWRQLRSRFLSQVVGPHFEQVSREWARWYAGPDTLGGFAARVAAGTVHDPAAKIEHEVDLAVFQTGESEGEELLAIGEAKWNETMDVGHLRRLEHIRELLRDRGIATPETRLLCFSGSGFSEQIQRTAAQDPRIQLIDPHRLYQGD